MWCVQSWSLCMNAIGFTRCLVINLCCYLYVKFRQWLAGKHHLQIHHKIGTHTCVREFIALLEFNTCMQIVQSSINHCSKVPVISNNDSTQIRLQTQDKALQSLSSSSSSHSHPSLLKKLFCVMHLGCKSNIYVINNKIGCTQILMKTANYNTHIKIS